MKKMSKKPMRTLKLPSKINLKVRFFFLLDSFELSV